MITTIISLLEKAEGLTRRVKKNLQLKTNKQYQTLSKWYEDDLHNLKKSTFTKLTEESTVFDLGGYEGQWSSDVYARYNCNVYIFEPVKAYADIIKDRFKQNSKIQVFQYGLAGSNQEVPITIDEFASTILNNKVESKQTEIIKLMDFHQFIIQENINSIDLIKINIEGAEYDLLEYLIGKNLINKIGSLLIQFHNFSNDAEKRMKEILERLSATHQQVYDYPFVWTFLEKRD
jgi:FkbM family methyltransferase